MSQLHRTETRCIELEEARSKALREASSLSEEMEDLKSKDGVADELQKCLQVVELELELKQNEVQHVLLKEGWSQVCMKKFRMLCCMYMTQCVVLVLSFECANEF